MPYLGIWTKPDGSGPFVCIEPWFGIADSMSGNGVFKDKPGIMGLEVGEEFSCSYRISVF